jgi:hypothetical protein
VRGAVRLGQWDPSKEDTVTELEAGRGEGDVVEGWDGPDELATYLVQGLGWPGGELK